MMATQTYKPPTSGLLSLLPLSWVPYAELIRLNNPAGILYFYFPFLFGLLSTACAIEPCPSPYYLCKVNLALLASIVAFRGAAVAWNDILDADLDRQVTRCQLRPMARNAIPPFKALCFAAAHLFAWILISSRLSREAVSLSTPYAIMHAIYPVSKRVTHYAPVILGLTFAWGVFIADAVLRGNFTNIDLEYSVKIVPSSYSLYAACALWTIIYETIYQFQDLQDDAKAGIGSMAVQHSFNTKWMLSGIAVAQFVCLELAGLFMSAGILYHVGSCSTVIFLTVMIVSVDLNVPNDCMWWFKNGTWMVGGSTSIGLLLEYLERAM